MGVCLLNSVSPSVSQHLEADKDKWFFTNRGGKDGLLIFKLLMQYSLQTTSKVWRRNNKGEVACFKCKGFQ
jgi:hypothetical protein